MKKKLIMIIISIFFVFLLVISATYVYYEASLDAVDNSNTNEVIINIEAGSFASEIISLLKENDLIKNELTMRIYAKTVGGTPMAGRYVFSKSMNANSIWNDIISGNVKNDTVWITFVEGKRLTYIKKQIASFFPYTEDEIDAVLEDKDYINSLIEKYDVLTENILDKNIYHSLEGYLFPDTYEFARDASIKDIIEKMISTLDAKMSKYSSEISNSKFSIHKILTLASIIELEGARSDDRNGVSGVFYNRLNSGWTLGSDVTTYYAVNKDFSEDLSRSELNSCNAYNTRGACVKGLPIGPIASVSIKSIESALNPTKHDYYYFVADKNGKTYFSKTDSEHNKIIRELQSNGLWYTYK